MEDIGSYIRYYKIEYYDPTLIAKNCLNYYQGLAKGEYFPCLNSFDVVMLLTLPPL